MTTQQIKPLTDDDIVALRTRAAEGGVSWDRAKAASEAVAKVKAMRLARRQRRNRLLIAGLGVLLFLLAVMGWYLTRR